MLSCDGYKTALVIGISESSVVICIRVGSCQGRYPSGKSTRDTIILIYVNNMPIQVHHGVLLQFVVDIAIPVTI